MTHFADDGEKRLAAMHAAGHLVIARHLGVRTCSARLYRPNFFSVWKDDFRADAGEMESLPVFHALMVGTAGAMAEIAWHRYTQPSGRFQKPPRIALCCVSGLNQRAAFLRTFMGTDTRGGPARAAEDVWILISPGFGPLWEPLCRIAGTLMQRGTVSEEDAP